MNKYQVPRFRALAYGDRLSLTWMVNSCLVGAIGRWSMVFAKREGGDTLHVEAKGRGIVQSAKDTILTSELADELDCFVQLLSHAQPAVTSNFCECRIGYFRGIRRVRVWKYRHMSPELVLPEGLQRLCDEVGFTDRKLTIVENVLYTTEAVVLFLGIPIGVLVLLVWLLLSC